MNSEPMRPRLRPGPHRARRREVSDTPSDCVEAARRRSGYEWRVVFGAHVILFSEDAEADRSFLASVFGFESGDAGGGWLIFALPPAELAVHPAEHPMDQPGAALYLMCRDLDAEMRRLRGEGVECSEVEEARWGSVTMIPLPGGGQVGLYEPRHPTMVEGP